MRIDAYSAISQAYAPARGVNKVKQESVSSYNKDELQISSIGKDFQTAKQAISAAPDVREDLVASMKEKYAGSDYDVDPGSFADMLISRFNQMI